MAGHYFGKRSKRNLDTCDQKLKSLFMAVIEEVDCTILCGHRSDTAQNEAFDTGHSKAKAGQSPHNVSPSVAIDVAPYPIEWGNTKRFYHFAGVVRGMAKELGIHITWGGDWDGDYDLDDKDQIFMDLVHFELVK